MPDAGGFDFGGASQGGSNGAASASVAGDWLLRYPAQQGELARQHGIQTGNNALDQQLLGYKTERLNRRRQALLGASQQANAAQDVFNAGIHQADVDRGAGQSRRAGGQAVALSKLQPSVGGQTAWGRAAAGAQAPRLANYRTALQRSAGNRELGYSMGRNQGALSLTGAGIDRRMGNEDMRDDNLSAFGGSADAELRQYDMGPGAGYYDRMLAASLLQGAGAGGGGVAGGLMSGGGK
jgi:hypothetical protein